jgi:NAD(P)H-nitrite reductase large subunit
VVLATGVQPTPRWRRPAAFAARGIVVDHQMQTSAPDV